MKIINIFTICLAVIFESFFGVFVSNAMKFSPEDIKSAHVYMKKELQEICDRLNKEDTTFRAKMRLLQEASNYSSFSDKHIQSLMNKIIEEASKEQANQLDKEYNELLEEIKSKEKNLSEIQKKLGECKGGNEYINSIQNGIENCIALIEDVKAKMKEYDETRYIDLTNIRYILDKKNIIIQKIEKSMGHVWVQYDIICRNMYYMSAECDSNSSEGGKHVDTYRDYLQELFGNIKTDIETFKNHTANNSTNTLTK